MDTQSKIFIQIDNDQIELTGKAKEDFLADRKEINDRETARQAKEAESAAKKLALLERLGLTADEAALLLA